MTNQTSAIHILYISLVLHLFLQLQSLIELRTVEREPQLTSTQLQFNNRHTKNEKTVLDSSLYLIPHTYKFTG